MDSLSSPVWERYGRSEISRNLFMLLYGAFTMAGLLATAIVSYFTTGWMKYTPAIEAGGKASFEYVGPGSLLVLAIVVLVVTIAGVLIALKSDNPFVSFIGYMMVAIPFGALLGPTVGMYQAESVVKVIFVTFSVVAVFTVIGACIPDSLESWGAWLFGGLTILLIGSFGIPLLAWLIPGFPLEGALTLWDWLGVLLFSAYVIFDVNRAMRVPATVDNAIDCALALYLDILNLFIRLLEIMGKKKD